MFIFKSYFNITVSPVDYKVFQNNMERWNSFYLKGETQHWIFLPIEPLWTLKSFELYWPSQPRPGTADWNLTHGGEAKKCFSLCLPIFMSTKGQFQPTKYWIKIILSIKVHIKMFKMNLPWNSFLYQRNVKINVFVVEYKRII